LPKCQRDEGKSFNVTSAMQLIELVREFEACTLPPAAWTHAAHLSVAFWYLHSFPRDEATRLIRSGIKRYNNAQRKSLAYHETITLAWIEVLARFLDEQDHDTPLANLLDRLLDRCCDKNYLLQFYSRERLFSDAARIHWLPPDVMEFC
jgi:hypothetical protein